MKVDLFQLDECYVVEGVEVMIHLITMDCQFANISMNGSTWTDYPYLWTHLS